MGGGGGFAANSESRVYATAGGSARRVTSHRIASHRVTPHHIASHHVWGTLLPFSGDGHSFVQLGHVRDTLEAQLIGRPR